MQRRLRFATQALLFATGVAFALAGCVTVGDDDDTAAAGDQGGSGGGAGMGGAGGAGECIATDKSCTVNSDCCAYDEGHGFCVGGVCAEACTKPADCASGCCGTLQAGGMACGPTYVCEGGTCGAAGDACAVNSDCCSFAESKGYCVGGTCADACKLSTDCTSGCCAALTTGGSACAPSLLCQ